MNFAYTAAMDIVLLKLLSAIVIFVVTIISGWLPFKHRFSSESPVSFPLGEAVASGVFLGASLIHMLGDASMSFARQGHHYPFSFLLAGSAFMVLLWLEFWGQKSYSKAPDRSGSFVLIATVMLSLHALLAGAALGLNDEWPVFLAILLAILTHKWAASFALSVQINQSALTARARVSCFVVFALMSPLGILLGGGIHHALQGNALIEPVFLSLAAGTLLYLGTLHGFKHVISSHETLETKQLLAALFGFALMATVAIWV